MPKARSSTISYLPLPRQKLPRRVREEDAEAQYRKEKFGQPGPVDAWLAARLGQGAYVDVNCALGKDEVRCTVQVQRIKAPSDGSIFADPDTFVLHLTTTSALRTLGPGPHALEPGRRIELGKYEGHPESLDAPQWTKLPAGRPVVFRDSAAAVAELLVRAAPWKDTMTPLLESLRSVSLDG